MTSEVDGVEARDGKAEKSWKERLRIFLLVLCSVVFVVSGGYAGVFTCFGSLISITRRVLKSSRFILPGG